MNKPTKDLRKDVMLTGDTLDNPAADYAKQLDREFKRLLKKFEIERWINPRGSRNLDWD